MNFDEAFIGEAKDYLVENLKCEVLYVEGKAASIELPSPVMLKVTESAEGVRGDSANNVQKAGRARDRQDDHRAALHQGRRARENLDDDRRIPRARVSDA